ncbi:MAG: hypothetical protein IPO19_09425 [Rhodoferax sp.]|nr:hypothetical protein [Rhodoferax sp.]
MKASSTVQENRRRAYVLRLGKGQFAIGDVTSDRARQLDLHGLQPGKKGQGLANHGAQQAALPGRRLAVNSIRRRGRCGVHRVHRNPGNLITVENTTLVRTKLSVGQAVHNTALPTMHWDVSDDRTADRVSGPFGAKDDEIPTTPSPDFEGQFVTDISQTDLRHENGF